ncbi:MAG: chemotaxis protein CheW [Bdellovibrionales bacterium]
MSELSSVAGTDARYLLFRVGEELYGTPLLGVREVVEPQACKKMPNTVPYFKGLINIRGEIVGVIDLRIRFSQSAEDEGAALIVFDTDAGAVGALVDQVDSVLAITEDIIDKNPNVGSMVPVEFLVGIAKLEDKLVSLVDLNKTLGNEELSQLRTTKLSASA